MGIRQPNPIRGSGRIKTGVPSYERNEFASASEPSTAATAPIGQEINEPIKNVPTTVAPNNKATVSFLSSLAFISRALMAEIMGSVVCMGQSLLSLPAFRVTG